MKQQKVVEVMRKEKGWHAIMSETRDKIILARQFGIKSKKYITLVLTHSKGNYILEHPNYEFVNRVAHFKSVQKDIRLSLNKTYLGSIIHALKRAGVWPYIMNKSFLRVNTENTKSDKGKVRRELAGLLSKN
jgi:hypothetical protein